MTLRDLMEQITIQGHVVIKRIEDDGETVVILDAPDFEADRNKLHDGDLDRPVAYLYPAGVCDLSHVAIEVE